MGRHTDNVRGAAWDLWIVRDDVNVRRIQYIDQFQRGTGDKIWVNVEHLTRDGGQYKARNGCGFSGLELKPEDGVNVLPEFELDGYEKREIIPGELIHWVGANEVVAYQTVWDEEFPLMINGEYQEPGAWVLKVWDQRENGDELRLDPRYRLHKEPFVSMLENARTEMFLREKKKREQARREQAEREQAARRQAARDEDDEDEMTDDEEDDDEAPFGKHNEMEQDWDVD